MKFLLDSFECLAYRPNAGDGQQSTTADVNRERCIYIEQSQMGSRNFGSDGPVITIGATQPDEIQINRGACGRVGAVGRL